MTSSVFMRIKPWRHEIKRWITFVLDRDCLGAFVGRKLTETKLALVGLPQDERRQNFILLCTRHQWRQQLARMPAVKGLLAPRTTFLETIAARFDGAREWRHPPSIPALFHPVHIRTCVSLIFLVCFFLHQNSPCWFLCIRWRSCLSGTLCFIISFFLPAPSWQ